VRTTAPRNDEQTANGQQRATEERYPTIHATSSGDDHERDE
jgi:hypothetical protein